MAGAGSTPKWVWVVGLAAVGVVVWRVVVWQTHVETTELPIVCTECKFAGMAAMPKGTKWPAKCPKCGKMTAYFATKCVKCGRWIPFDPDAPSSFCPYCKAATKPGTGGGVH